MLLFLAFVLIVIVWTRLESTRSKLAETRESVRRQWRGHDKVAELAVEVGLLKRRLGELEKIGVAAPAVEPIVVKATVVEVPPSVYQAPPAAEETDARRAPPPLPEVAEAAAASLPSPLPPPLPPPAPPRAHDDVAPAQKDWEALIGGNLLNKLGALVLVIGIALFLSYSFTQMGAAGRALTGMSVSAAMLAGGLWRERKAEYRVFARGVIAAGWASLYFTSYAMHAVEATRVIENPVAGLVAMFAVAAAMIWHSLRYKVQALTALAYGCAFASLALTGLTFYAAAALVPLAASLLYLAWRYDWHEMALFGAAAAYATFLTRPDQGATLMAVQGMLLIFWMMFETFDLWRISLCRPAAAVHHAFFAVNAAAGLGASAAIWFRKAPDSMWQFCLAAAALYLASATIRILLDEKSRYEASLALSAALTGLAIFAEVPGIWTSLALMLEAEILFLAGFYLRLRLARACSLFAFAWSVFLLTLRTGSTAALGVQVDVWAVPLALHALVFYVNRYLDKGATYFGYFGSAFAAVVVGCELPWRYAGGAWLIFGAGLFELGCRRRLTEFRDQAYALGLLGVVGIALSFLDPLYVWRAWIHGMAAVGALLCSIRAQRGLKELPETERLGMRVAGSAGAALLAWMFLLRAVPDGYEAVAILATSAFFFELALRRMPGEMRIPAPALNVLGLIQLLLGQVLSNQKTHAPEVWISLAGSAAAYYWLAGRTLRSTDPAGMALRAFSLICGSVLAARTLWVVLPDAYVPLAMGALAMLSLEIGRLLQAADVVTQGHVLSVVSVAVLGWMSVHGNTAGRLVNGAILAALHWYLWWREREKEEAPLHGWLAGVLAAGVIWLEYPDQTLAAWSALGLVLAGTGKWFRVQELRWHGAALAIVAFGFALFSDAAIWQRSVVAAWFLISMALESPENEGQQLRQGYSLLAALLIAVTLFRDVSGSMLTLSWGVEGIGLLALGFIVRERTLRLSGLALLLACILKLFVYDLRTLETMFRILSFIGLGVILLAVSWIYTRFKDQIQKYF